MCAGAAWAAQVGRVVFGAADLKAGATGSLYNVAVDQRLNHTSEVRAGVRADECAALLTSFFAGLRPHLTTLRGGGLPERTNGTVSKTVVAFGSPWVQIPHPPPHQDPER